MKRGGGRRGRPPPRTKFGRAKPSRICLPNLFCRRTAGPSTPSVPSSVGLRPSEFILAYKIWSGKALPNLSHEFIFAGGRRGRPPPRFVGGRRGPPAPAHQIRAADASRTHVLECTPPKIGGGPRLSGGRGCGRGSCTSRRIRTCGGRAASKRGKTPKSANNI